MSKRVYEERKNGFIYRLSLDDVDGSFVYDEEEDRIHGSGGGASGRFRVHGATLFLDVTKTSFEKGWGWDVGATIEAPFAISLADATLRLVR